MNEKIEEYESSFRGFVHFSFKTVNSNAPAGGIRIDAADALNLPYVSARTLLKEGISCMTDYTKNSGRIATHFKHAKQARMDASGIIPKKKADKDGAKSAEKEDAPDLAPDELLAVGDALARCTQGRLEDGCDAFLDPRLRQLLLPYTDETGAVSYRSVTPLTAGGLCQIMRAHVAASNEAHKLGKEDWQKEKEKALKKNPKAVIARLATRSVQLTQLGIGGSNPQNVGGLVREMQQPMYMGAPQAKGSLRQALAMHHKGVDLNISLKLVRKYADFLKANTEDDVRQTAMESREEEKSILAEFVDDVMDQVDDIRRVLDQHLEMLPADTTGKHMYFTQKLHHNVNAAWVDESLRGRDWASLAAVWLANAIGKFEVQTKNGPKRLLSLDVFGIKSIEGLIEEFLV
ncbi:MAG TPA: type I-F CRISPR-associated protein Csy1 [Rhodoferax sp.]|nr:type I-F CRISPR-associated protein Csy1 [Rhodoferax sp.]